MTATNTYERLRESHILYLIITKYTLKHLYVMGADRSLARPGRKQATFLAFCVTSRFVTTFTAVHHLSLL